MTGFEILKAVLALLFVLGLIGTLAWLLRRAGGLPGLARSAGRGAHRRLSVSESLALDTRHRLVLVRRDGHEHLLLLGPAGSTVVESTISGADAPDTTARAGQ